MKLNSGNRWDGDLRGRCVIGLNLQSKTAERCRNK